jgi:hypothetical protein
MSKHKEVEAYESFFPACHGEVSSHVTQVPPVKKEEDEAVNTQVEEELNDSLGG